MRQWYQAIPTANTRLKDGIWKKLESKGYVDVALQESETALGQLLGDAEPYLEGAEMQARSPSPPKDKYEEQEEKEEVQILLSDLERERAAAFEEHVARIAANDFYVRRYRGRVLGGEILSPEQAQTFIHSPAAAVLSQVVFMKRGIPSTNHKAELISAEWYRADGRDGYRFTVWVEPPGIERTVNRLLRELPFVDEGKFADSIMVGDGSVLGDLAELADKLHKIYPWESKEEIVHFVLTGAVPAVPPLMMYYSRKIKSNVELSPGGFRHGKITLEVAPWISAKTVERAFRDAKRQVSRNRKYRRLDKKSLKMIRFIAGYENPPKGRRLLEAWNETVWVEENPAWYYDPEKRGASSRFWRDYHRARRALAYEKRPRREGG